MKTLGPDTVVCYECRDKAGLRCKPTKSPAILAELRKKQGGCWHCGRNNHAVAYNTLKNLRLKGKP